jgi:exosortase
VEAAPAVVWHVPLAVWVCLGLWAAAMAPTISWMYGEWTGSVWHNTHGWLIPVLMVLLGRNILRRMPEHEDTPTAWGFALLLPGLALTALDAGAGTRFLSAVGLVLSLPGLSLLLLGPLRTRALALPLVLAIFMIPLPNTFSSQMYLRTLTAAGVAPLLSAIGIPTLVDHSVLELPQSTFLVADACSGFSTLYSTVAMAVLLGTLCESKKRRIVVYLSILPLAIAANIARVLILVMIFLYIDPALLDSAMHGASGVATFFVVLLGLMLISNRPSLRKALL